MNALASVLVRTTDANDAEGVRSVDSPVIVFTGADQYRSWGVQLQETHEFTERRLSPWRFQ